LAGGRARRDGAALCFSKWASGPRFVADFLNLLDSWIAFRREDGWLTERRHYRFQTTEWTKGR
jgi:hypothetical protein